MKRQELIQHVKEHSVRLDSFDDLDALVEAIGDKKYVLLGEASHGTSEFYTFRTELTKRLVLEKGFSFIAVEGDWPSCYPVNRYVKGYENFGSAREALKAFDRWPTWMWANEEVQSLIEWMKEFNENTSRSQKVGFYGLDVYSLWESMEEVISFLEKSGSADVKLAREAFSCFEPFSRKPESYGVSAAFYGEDCMDEVQNLLRTIRENRQKYTNDKEAALDLEVNAIVASNAEHYYHAMLLSDSESWNIRDMHMVEAFHKIIEYYGSDTKAIIWEHNTHIGDARATDMAAEDMVNVGQLMREKYGSDNVYAVGFGSYTGTVVAAGRWGDELEVMMVPEAMENSWEEILHVAGAHDKLLLFHDDNRALFSGEIGHRAIGVVYQPHMERFGNYVPSKVSERYDGFIFIDQSKALHPLFIGELIEKR